MAWSGCLIVVRFSMPLLVWLPSEDEDGGDVMWTRYPMLVFVGTYSSCGSNSLDRVSSRSCVEWRYSLRITGNFFGGGTDMGGKRLVVRICTSKGCHYLTKPALINAHRNCPLSSVSSSPRYPSTGPVPKSHPDFPTPAAVRAYGRRPASSS